MNHVPVSRCLSLSMIFLGILSWKLSKVFSLEGGSETSVLSELTEAEDRFFLQNLGGFGQEPAQSSCSIWPCGERAVKEGRNSTFIGSYSTALMSSGADFVQKTQEKVTLSQPTIQHLRMKI